jgi:hypothetical protein
MSALSYETTLYELKEHKFYTEYPAAYVEAYLDRKLQRLPYPFDPTVGVMVKEFARFQVHRICDTEGKETRIAMSNELRSILEAPIKASYDVQISNLHYRVADRDRTLREKDEHIKDLQLQIYQFKKLPWYKRIQSAITGGW